MPGLILNFLIEEALDVQTGVVGNTHCDLVAEDGFACDSECPVFAPGFLSVEEALGIETISLKQLKAQALISDSVGIADISNEGRTVDLFVSEVLRCADASLRKPTLLNAIEDAVGLQPDAVVQRLFSLGVEEAIDFQPALTWFKVVRERVESRMACHAGMTSSRSYYRVIEDGFELEISFAIPNAIFWQALEDEIDIDADSDEESIVRDDTVWECWVLNSSQMFPSIYTGFNFNSYAEFKGVLYATADNGIYKLSDDHEEDIHTGILLPPTSFGTLQNKRFRSGYLGYTGDVPAIKVKTDDGDEKVLAVRRNRIEMHRSDAGRRWQFTVAEFDTLNFVELFPIILSRSRQK